MFDNIGWTEIFTIVVIGLIIIGPEKLPGVIKDVQAAIFAARRAISNARAELDGQFGEEFDEFREPINQVAQWQKMGPKRALTQALFDGDEKYLEDFDPKKIMSGDTAGSAHRARQTPVTETQRVERNPETVGDGIPEVTETERAPRPPSQDSTARTIADNTDRDERGSGGGFSWADVT